MADEGVEQRGQSELERCELTHRSNSSDLSLIEVISSPSGKGNSGVVSILCHLLQHILQEHSRPTNIFQWFTKNQDEPLAAVVVELTLPIRNLCICPCAKPQCSIVGCLQ